VIEVVDQEKQLGIIHDKIIETLAACHASQKEGVSVLLSLVVRALQDAGLSKEDFLDEARKSWDHHLEGLTPND
jgi:uncharacterized protein YjiS (DUF1127 family)